ncbi:hypothetical protein [Actinomadura fibrosa]|uniref:MFS transporter n=1 Tax=Actinomadura fibrosa TaxID=111802 RepID=A0ABW2XZR0_9ACTN|nr:hypothetical protein [Actinomadura fibrosa]
MTAASSSRPGPRPRVRYRDAFALPEFRVLFALQALQVGGDAVRMLALSVQVFERTGSALASALAFGAGLLPYVLGGALLLALADRVPARRLLAGTHLLRLVVTAVLALDGTPVPAAIALVAALGLAAPVGAAAVQARLAALLPGDGLVLGRSLFLMTAAGAQIAGQAAGGLLLAAVAPSGALWLAAAGGSGVLAGQPDASR